MDGIELPPGRYLISVMADGYKVDGEHFIVPLEEPGLLTVEAHPLPLPPAQMVVKIFNDRVMTNGQYDGPAEDDLEGFRVLIHDIAGEITTDLFGNPLCSEYERDINGDIIFDVDGNPIPILGTGGECLSDANGEVTIPFIGPMRYDVLVVPPDGTQWIQTMTLEGSLGWDTWLQEAGTGLDNEFVIAAEPFPGKCRWCSGNFSAEYGGGISHYGYSPGGAIFNNRIYFNRSYDEGGGIMIAGELPVDPDTLSAGAGKVDVYGNQIQANLGNDDGGGLRFLMSGNFVFNVYITSLPISSRPTKVAVSQSMTHRTCAFSTIPSSII
ncbi:MAG: hypothetical protein P1S60_17630 [Anaerolineae bacterium]|nr:hypothetical protein [Anaerolineae bacterium]